MVQSEDLRDINEIIFANIEQNKLGLKYATILGHNNETQLCLILRIIDQKESKDNRFIQILTITEMDTNFYFTK